MTTVAEGLEALRAEFPAEAIGKLPKVTCPACSKKECREHTKKRCDVCAAVITPAHIHIDFVGHAEVTDRLLTVDPSWSWEPYALDPNGLPAMTRNERQVPVGMWIRLTVLGITRPGYGSCEPKPDAVKELIGDALRNAAMRFGVALSLWSKNDLESAIAEAEVEQDSPGEAAPVAARGRSAVAKAKAAVASSRASEPPLPNEKPEPPAPVANGHKERSEAAGEGASGDAAPNPAGMTGPQRNLLFSLLNGSGIREDAAQHDYASSRLGREVKSMTELTKADATKLIDDLKRLAGQPA